jgi:hypothetical protein
MSTALHSLNCGLCPQKTQEAEHPEATSTPGSPWQAECRQVIPEPSLSCLASPSWHTLLDKGNLARGPVRPWHTVPPAKGLPPSGSGARRCQGLATAGGGRQAGSRQLGVVGRTFPPCLQQTQIPSPSCAPESLWLRHHHRAQSAHSGWKGSLPPSGRGWRNRGQQKARQPSGVRTDSKGSPEPSGGKLSSIHPWSPTGMIWENHGDHAPLPKRDGSHEAQKGAGTQLGTPSSLSAHCSYYKSPKYPAPISRQPPRKSLQNPPKSVAAERKIPEARR